MTKNTSAAQLKNWFGYLQSFQTCAGQINTDLAALSLLAFATSKPATYLTDANDQNQFAVCVTSKTQIPLQASEATADNSFVELLNDKFGAVNAYVAAYLQWKAGAVYTSMNIGDFTLQKTSVVYPEGSTDPIWIKTDTGLAKIIDSSCYSAQQRADVVQIVAGAGKQINDVINQIAKLG